jgi:hypothetical protein
MNHISSQEEAKMWIDRIKAVLPAGTKFICLTSTNVGGTNLLTNVSKEGCIKILKQTAFDMEFGDTKTMREFKSEDAPPQT